MSAKGRAAEGYTPDPNGFFQTQPQVTRAILPFLGIEPGMRILEPSCGKGAIAKVLRETYGNKITIVGVEIDKKRSGFARRAKVEVPSDKDDTIDAYFTEQVFDDVIHSDFYKVTRTDHFGPFDLVITNPSFEIWLPFANHSFSFAPRTTFLLPWNAASSKKRATWWREHPAHLRVLSKRPSFAISVKCVYSNARRAHAAGANPCTFQELIALDEKPKKECPICGERTETTSSDASEYCWASWAPDITRGLWDVIDTPDEEEKGGR